MNVATYPCARCGKKQPAEKMTYSRFTRNRYCREMFACDRRFFSKKKREEGAAA